MNISIECDHHELFCDITNQLGIKETIYLKKMDYHFIIQACSKLEDSAFHLKNNVPHFTNHINIENIHLDAYYYCDKSKYIIYYENLAYISIFENKVFVNYNLEKLNNVYHSVYSPYLLCTSLLYELFAIKGHYLIIHASGIAKKGKGVIFLAKKGSGKSTLSLSMSLTCQYDYLSDDKIIYNRDEHLIHSIPDVIRLNKDVYHTIFPHDTNSNMKLSVFRDKFVINLAQLPLNYSSYTIPNIIIVPSINHDCENLFEATEASTIEILDEMLQHRIVAFEQSQSEIIQNAFSIINKCKRYTLKLGRQVDYNIHSLNQFINNELGI